MQNPTFPEDTESIPDLTFEAIKNQIHSDRLLRKTPLDTITSFPYRCNSGRVSAHKAGDNLTHKTTDLLPSVKGNQLGNPSQLYDFLGVDYVAP